MCRNFITSLLKRPIAWFVQLGRKGWIPDLNWNKRAHSSYKHTQTFRPDSKPLIFEEFP